MKEEELIKRLENVELPEIEVPSHRRRLRMALLHAGYPLEQPRITIWGLAKSKLKGGISMTKELVSRQPVWKTAMASVLAVALIIGLSLGIPALTGQSPEVLAAEIAQNSPQVKAACGGEGEVEVVKLTITNGKGEVICVAKMGRLVAADVDLEAGEVTEVEVLSMPELSDEDKAEAINIAKADSRVQELLGQGASIGKVFPVYSSSIIVENGQARILPTSNMAMVELKHGEEGWLARVDLDKKKVQRIIESSEPLVAEFVTAIGGSDDGGIGIGEGYSSVTIGGPPVPPMTEEEKAEAVSIAEADRRVKELLDEGASIGEIMGCLMAGFVESEDGKMITMSSPSRVKALVPVELEGKRWIAQVDMENKEVTNLIPMFTELTEAEKEEIIDIAKADPEVKELLDKGAVIGKILPMVSFGTRMDQETGEVEEFSGTLVRVEIELGDESWTAHVDLAEGKVVRLLETTPGAGGSYSDPEGRYRIEYFEGEKE